MRFVSVRDLELLKPPVRRRESEAVRDRCGASGGSSSRCEDASTLSTVRAPLVAGLLSTSCSESEGVELKETLLLRVLGRAEEVDGLPFA